MKNSFLYLSFILRLKKLYVVSVNSTFVSPGVLLYSYSNLHLCSIDFCFYPCMKKKCRNKIILNWNELKKALTHTWLRSSLFKMVLLRLFSTKRCIFFPQCSRFKSMPEINPESRESGLLRMLRNVQRHMILLGIVS